MDIRIYYQKVRQAESSIPGEYAVVVSLETPDGGKSGVKTEVSRPAGAKLMVEGRARLASEQESAEYYAEQELMRRRSEETEAAGRVQVTVLSDADVKALRAVKPAK